MYGHAYDVLREFWNHMTKAMVRMIITLMLGCITMVFQPPDELRKFVRNRLSYCTDSAEKAACVASIAEMMEEDDALV